MSNVHKVRPEEVEHLILNAQLRTELEPFFDDSIECMNVHELPTPLENEYLASMLAWERAPVLPIGQWFDPPMTLANPDALEDAAVHAALWNAIERLHEKRIVLDFTDHLSDRQLYLLIARDILPSPEKMIAGGQNFLHWDCSNAGDDTDVWLRYYASLEDREMWQSETGGVLPACELPPHPRDLPRAE